MSGAEEGSNRTTDAEPSGPPEGLERPRWWSNPGLTDRDTIIAIVLADPTTVDLARTMAHYGLDVVEDVRRRTEDERSPSENRTLDMIYGPVAEGVRDALGRAG